MPFSSTKVCHPGMFECDRHEWDVCPVLCPSTSVFLLNISTAEVMMTVTKTMSHRKCQILTKCSQTQISMAINIEKGVNDIQWVNTYNAKQNRSSGQWTDASQNKAPDCLPLVPQYQDTQEFN
jgi:hypothetical protein